MSRHATRRLPKETTGFAWGRFPTEDGSAIAQRLRRACHQLRDKFDEIDLAAMDAAKETA